MFKGGRGQTGPVCGAALAEPGKRQRQSNIRQRFRRLQDIHPGFRGARAPLAGAGSQQAQPPRHGQHRRGRVDLHLRRVGAVDRADPHRRQTSGKDCLVEFLAWRLKVTDLVIIEDRFMPTSCHKTARDFATLVTRRIYGAEDKRRLVAEMGLPGANVSSFQRPKRLTVGISFPSRARGRPTTPARRYRRSKNMTAGISCTG